MYIYEDTHTVYINTDTHVYKRRTHVYIQTHMSICILSIYNWYIQTCVYIQAVTRVYKDTHTQTACRMRAGPTKCVRLRSGQGRHRRRKRGWVKGILKKKDRDLQISTSTHMIACIKTVGTSPLQSLIIQTHTGVQACEGVGRGGERERTRCVSLSL